MALLGIVSATRRLMMSSLHSVHFQKQVPEPACKWAESRVAIASLLLDGGIAITVDDDGPGLAPALRDSVLKRGVRVDEAAPGSGLGLAIVADLAELHGGSITLDTSPAGGLRARLELPT